MMAIVTEIGDNLYRISTFSPNADMQINQFLIKDNEPLLWHTGLKEQFPAIREAIAKIIDPSELRWIGFSHFEADECGALNEWLRLAPSAQTICSEVGVAVNINDYAIRSPRGMSSEEIIDTGAHRFRFYATPHLPHGWDAGMLFEETDRILFCSDLFHQNGDQEPLISSEIKLLDRSRKLLEKLRHTSFASYIPLTSRTVQQLHTLAALRPKILAIMHGSSFSGNGGQALRDLASIMQEIIGPKWQ